MARRKKTVKIAKREDHDEQSERAMELTRPEPGRKGPNKVARHKSRKATRRGGRR